MSAAKEGERGRASLVDPSASAESVESVGLQFALEFVEPAVLLEFVEAFPEVGGTEADLDAATLDGDVSGVVAVVTLHTLASTWTY